MSVESENEALLRLWFEEIWNQKRPEMIAKLAAPDIIAHGMGPGGSDMHGVEGFRQAYDTFSGAFPDLHLAIEQTVASEDRVAMLLTCTATHGGDHLGVPATGKPVKFQVMTIVRFQDGKMVEGWNVLELLTAMQQIGVAPK